MTKPVRVLLIVLILIVFSVAFIGSSCSGAGNVLGGSATRTLRFDELVTCLKHHEVAIASWRENVVSGKLTNGTEFSCVVPDRNSEGGYQLANGIATSGAQLTFDRPPLAETIVAILSVIAFPAMILAVLYVLLIRPAQRSMVSQRRTITPTAIYTGTDQQETESFTVPPGRQADVCWSTSPAKFDGKLIAGCFSATLMRMEDKASVQHIATIAGEGSGTASCRNPGSFYIAVVADQRWTIKVFVQ